MSYYSKFRGRNGRDRERDNYFGPRRDRERSWNRNRNSTFFRTREHDYDRKDYRHFRRDRDEGVVMIRRDKEREETKRQVHNNKEEPKTEFIRRSRSPDHRNLNPAPFPNPEFNESSCRPFPPNFTQAPPPPPWEDFPEDSNANHPIYLGQPEMFPFKTEPPEPQPPPPQQPAGPSRLSEKGQEIINSCIANFKTRGDYDRIRRECMLDIDTKPAFINAMGKVTDITNRFLQTAQYHPSMDKARMRENLKKSFELSKSYQNGLESLVNQILQPKIASILQPMIEKEIFQSLEMDASTNAAAATETSGSSECSEADALQNAAVEDEVGNEEVKPTTISCLVPMNVIIESKPETFTQPPSENRPSPCFKSTFKPLDDIPSPITNEVDLQLHNDILEELQEETKAVFVPKPDLEDFVLPKLPEPVGIDKEETDIKLISPVNNGGILEDTSVVYSPMDTGSEMKPEVCKGQNEENGSPEDEGVGFLEEEEEDVEEEQDSESDEESPAFEKIGEISPVRVDMIPCYEFTPGEDSIKKEIGSGIEYPSTPPYDSSHVLPERDTSGNYDGGEQTLCKFLDPLELLTDKMLYYKKIAKLSG